MNIKDEYGRKIGGSKRDLWKTRGMEIADLDLLNDQEKETYVKKDNVFPKPDYEALAADGVPTLNLFYVKYVRDAIAAKPRYADHKEYVRYVSEIRDLLLNNMRKDSLTAFKGVLREYICRDTFVRGRYSTTTLNNIGGPNLYNKICRSNHSIEMAMEKTEFLYSDADKILAKYKFFHLDDNTVIEKFDDGDRGKDTDICLRIKGLGFFRIMGLRYEDAIKLPKGAYIAAKYYSYILSDENLDDLKAKIVQLEQATAALNPVSSTSPTQKKRKGKFTPVQLSRIERIGGDNIRESNVDGDDLLKKYTFYGAEFGNYMTDNDRQETLNMAYDALHDLAIALNIDEKDISLNGKLAIAFGARGHGRAAAHYEPERNVINLTKMNGAGSLAHEYGHAIDYILGREIYGKACSDYRAGYRGRDYSVPENNFDDCVIKVMKRNPDRSFTNFYENSMKFDKNYSKEAHGYWASEVEMFARAFACFIEDTLKEKGIRSDFLCGSADSARVKTESGEILTAYPEGEERVRINAAIKKFLDENLKSLKKKTAEEIVA